jgi:hypothetical protein
MGVEQIFEILPQADEVDQAAPRLHLDQKVNVAPGARLATSDRAEHAHIARAVLGDVPQDFIPSGTKLAKVELSGFGTHLTVTLPLLIAIGATRRQPKPASWFD